MQWAELALVRVRALELSVALVTVRLGPLVVLVVVLLALFVSVDRQRAPTVLVSCVGCVVRRRLPSTGG